MSKSYSVDEIKDWLSLIERELQECADRTHSLQKKALIGEFDDPEKAAAIAEGLQQWHAPINRILTHSIRTLNILREIADND